MNLSRLVRAIIWFPAMYFGLGVFVESHPAYFGLGVASLYLFMILESRI